MGREVKGHKRQIVVAIFYVVSVFLIAAIIAKLGSPDVSIDVADINQTKDIETVDSSQPKACDEVIFGRAVEYFFSGDQNQLKAVMSELEQLKELNQSQDCLFLVTEYYSKSLNYQTFIDYYNVYDSSYSSSNIVDDRISSFFRTPDEYAEDLEFAKTSLDNTNNEGFN